MKRRDFLWLLGVISGSTVMSACGSPNRSAKFTSYLLPPEEGIVPGEASYHPVDVHGMSRRLRGAGEGPGGAAGQARGEPGPSRERRRAVHPGPILPVPSLPP